VPCLRQQRKTGQLQVFCYRLRLPDPLAFRTSELHLVLVTRNSRGGRELTKGNLLSALGKEKICRLFCLNHDSRRPCVWGRFQEGGFQEAIWYPLIADALGHRPDFALESPWERLRVHDDAKAGERFVIGNADRLSGPC